MSDKVEKIHALSNLRLIVKDQRETIRAQQHVIRRLRAALDSCEAALNTFVETDNDPEGTAAAALWNNGTPLGA